ncbi:SDR family NAD(P)-dependent oxidoreductase [Cytobacillus purgationiresistens]|uniref:NAD(P)-dependent dehydrogenase (Short-subunit alcohol dehydrogenase family) n=1 Tax=Cytobacillus purgationiresistens TaxID=863449 RepID=A0ABU0ACX2_9BACI|nr:SDR family NAD(P)-dependent oxidoreductase [Cytobacillus purgationiresistens]MDQ0268566.1 NAD(P)-dependent dehydrogenase (short-subunit alcohol dehydrogenase family) [Cytobacillus purgationiresistens]
MSWEAVKLFLREQVRVVFSDYYLQQVMLRQIQDYHGRYLCIEVDFANRLSVNRMVSKAIDSFGHIDNLINNADITKDAMLKKMKTEDFERFISVNLTGVFNCTLAVIPLMEQSQSGGIINTSSVSGIYGNIGQTNYSASKAGVIGMMKTCTKECGIKGITAEQSLQGLLKPR